MRIRLVVFCVLISIQGFTQEHSQNIIREKVMISMRDGVKLEWPLSRAIITRYLLECKGSELGKKLEDRLKKVVVRLMRP